MSIYTQNNVPLIAGAYLLNAAAGTNNSLVALPIFSSISNLSKMGFTDVDNIFWVLPGYKLEGYNSINYANLLFTMNNTTGTKIMYQDPSYGDNLVTSVKLYFNDTLLNEIYTFRLFSSS
jgi:hypothetical protein